MEKGHGRIETRRITVSHKVVPALDWPGVAQVGRIERTREIKGAISCETVYVITSLDRDHASPAALLTLARDHWGIENRLHWKRDVLLSEDASRVRPAPCPRPWRCCATACSASPISSAHHSPLSEWPAPKIDLQPLQP